MKTTTQLTSLALLTALSCSVASAAVVAFIPTGAGSVTNPANWGGTLPSGADIGVLTAANTNSWEGSGFLQDQALRVTGGYLNGVNGTTLRGGTSGSGITTILEFNTTDYETTVNYGTNTGGLDMWSQHGEKMELNVLAGQIQVDNMNLNATGTGTINMGEGLIHSGGLTSANVQINFLAGAGGHIVFDAIDDISVGSFYIDFASDNTGSFNIAQVAGGTSAQSKLQWMIENDRVSIGGIVNTDLASYNLEIDGLSTTLSIPEPGTYALLAGGFALASVMIRRRR